jgi:hypothetical protein
VRKITSRSRRACASAAVILACAVALGQAVLVIDMNDNVVKQWDGFNNSAGGPARVLPAREKRVTPPALADFRVA